MTFSEDDNLHLFPVCGLRRLLAEFSMKNWMKDSLDTLLKNVKETESTD